MNKAKFGKVEQVRCWMQKSDESLKKMIEAVNQIREQHQLIISFIASIFENMKQNSNNCKRDDEKAIVDKKRGNSIQKKQQKKQITTKKVQNQIENKTSMLKHIKERAKVNPQQYQSKPIQEQRPARTSHQQVIDNFYLPDSIESKVKMRFNLMGLNFKSSKRLYSFPEDARINFHQKIDNIKNVLLIMKLQNGNTIGAFTHLPFNPKPKYIPEQNPKSFICNFDKQIFLFADKINKTHCYDKNYLIFGNWEIKIKSGSNYLESDFGTHGDCFSRREYGQQLRFKKQDWIQPSNNKRQQFLGADTSSKKLQVSWYWIYSFE